MAMQRAQIGAIVAVALTVTVVGILAAGALMAYQASFAGTGAVKGVRVGVYSDGGCSKNLTSVDWGVVEAGGSVGFTLFLKNEGTIPVRINIATRNWSPAFANNYITLTWNREDYVLNAGSIIQGDLTLSVSPDTSGITSFSFEIVITGTEIQ